MDIATIVGLAGAFAMVIMAMGDPGPFYDFPSILIVVAGTAFVVLARSSIPEFIGAITYALKTVKFKIETPVELIEKLVELGTMAKGVRMMVDGTDSKLIQKALEIEAAQVKDAAGKAKLVWESIKEVAPAMGMIGTLVGLVIMLGNMSDPKSIGPAFAVALLTTMYGAVIANMIAIPVIQKVVNNDAKIDTNHQLIIEALMFIISGGNPRLLPDVLSGYVSPRDQSKLEAIKG
jgi:chemotaxis protein MotA